MPLNAWTHLAATYDGSALRLYTNGVLARSQNVAGSIAYAANALSLGGNTSWGEYFTGTIDEASFYNRALSAPELAAIVSARQLGKCLPPLTILVQPASRSALAGDPISLSVVAGGPAPLTYQWYRNGTNVIGDATNATLVFGSAQIADSGNYSVVVSNPYETVTSSTAILTVRQCFEAVDVALVIDRSTSMTNNYLEPGVSRLTGAKIACSNFIASLNFSTDQAALISFNATASTNQTLTNSAAVILPKLEALTGAYGTVMTNALLAAWGELSTTRHQTNALPVIVFLTDGKPQDNTSAIQNLATQIKTNGVRLITVAVGNDLGTPELNLLRNMASTTNSFFQATNTTQLTNVYSVIANSICRGETNQLPTVYLGREGSRTQVP